jgi:hypothetical protein
MALLDDIATISNSGLPEDQKRRAIYDLKTFALVDVIVNGKPVPNPIPPLLQREFTFNGLTIYIHSAIANDDGDLQMGVTFTKDGVPQTHTIIIRNPPVLPAQITGNEKQDLVQAAIEMMEGFV